LSDKTEDILKGLKKTIKDKDDSTKSQDISEEVEIEKNDRGLSEVDRNILDVWKKQEEEIGEVIPLIPPKLNLVFLPHLLTEAFLPSRKVGSPYKYQRRYGNLSIQISSSTYPNGDDIGLPHGLLARRLLVALVSKSVKESSRVIECGNIKSLMEDAGLTMTGKSHKATQKMLLQMATMNLQVWFQPDSSKKAFLYKGQMFDALSVDIYPSNQLNFRFIPEQIVLTKDFHEALLKDKAIPFLAQTIAKATSPLEHDTLVWLLHRLPRVSPMEPLMLTWSNLYQQLATPNMCHRQFKFRMKKVFSKIEKDTGLAVLPGLEGVVLSYHKAQVPFKNKNWPKLY
jgi:hypothetical protein